MCAPRICSYLYTAHIFLIGERAIAFPRDSPGINLDPLAQFFGPQPCLLVYEPNEYHSYIIMQTTVIGVLNPKLVRVIVTL